MADAGRRVRAPTPVHERACGADTDAHAAALHGATPPSAVDARAVAARAGRIQPALLAAFMSCMVSGVVTLVNTGIDSAYPLRWLKAWALAAPIAIVAAYLARGPAARLALRLARMTARG